jgi:hypothetical protein
MKIRVGYELIYDFPQPTPIIMVLGTHFTRASDVIVPDYLTTSPSVPIFPYRDVFGNWCSRIVAPAGRMRLSADGEPRQRTVRPSAFRVLDLDDGLIFGRLLDARTAGGFGGPQHAAGVLRTTRPHLSLVGHS